jgi:hypothetical protein
MIDIVDVVKTEIHAKLNRDVKVVMLLPLAVQKTFRVVLCDFKWLKKGMELIRVSDNEIFEVVQIGFTEVSGKQVKFADIRFFTDGLEVNKNDLFKIPLPFFIDGTQMSVNSELGIKAQYDLTKVTPLFWLHENINESVYPKNSAFERESTIEVFLLDKIIYHEGNDDNRKRGVKPMLSLADATVSAVDKNKAMFNREVNAEMRTISRFGKETERGIESYILDADLGGVKLKLTIDVNEKDCKC